MEAEPKIAFLNQFLLRRSLENRVKIRQDNLLDVYDPISIYIDWIETNAPELFAPPRSEVSKKAILEDILDHGCTFKKGSPPKLDSISQSEIRKRVAFWKRDIELSTLTGCDYYE